MKIVVFWDMTSCSFVEMINDVSQEPVVAIYAETY
jgi:hypothetical protein